MKCYFFKLSFVNVLSSLYFSSHWTSGCMLLCAVSAYWSPMPNLILFKGKILYVGTYDIYISVGPCVIPCDLPVDGDFIVDLGWLWSNMTEKNEVQISRPLSPFPARVFKVIQGHWMPWILRRPYTCQFSTYDGLWPLKLRRSFCWTWLDPIWWCMSFKIEAIKL